MSVRVVNCYEDTFDVYDLKGGQRIGQVALMSTGWAAYRATWSGRIVDERIGTYPRAADAIYAVDNHPLRPKALVS